MRFLPLSIFIALCNFSCSSDDDNSLSNELIQKETIHPQQFSLDSLTHIYDSLTTIDLKNRKYEKTFYPTGELEQSIEYKEYPNEFNYTIYYKNGARKVIGEQGVIAGCGIPIGAEMHYDSLKNLIHAITYNHYFAESESCHEIRTVKVFKDYFSNGIIEKTGSVETCYECDECPCGKWDFFDKKGNQIKSENYGDCFDGNLGCLE